MAIRQPNYIRTAFRTPWALADEAAGILVAKGALGCAVIGMRRSAPGPNKVVSLEAFFPHLSAARMRSIHRTMSEAGVLAPAAPKTAPEAERIADPGWATLWQGRFRPLRIGRRFLVVPPWNPTAEPGRIGIVIEPGQAFGTGHHPTTAGALRAMERLCRARPFESVLDVGTGSGILALGAARLGASRVVGIDLDRVALRNARANARANRLHGGVRFDTTPLARVVGRFDLVIANILGPVLLGLAPALKRRLNRGGALILGGILRREANDVAARFTPALKLAESRVARGWATMVFTR